MTPKEYLKREIRIGLMADLMAISIFVFTIRLLANFSSEVVTIALGPVIFVALCDVIDKSLLIIDSNNIVDSMEKRIMQGSVDIYRDIPDYNPIHPRFWTNTVLGRIIESTSSQ